MKDGKPTYTYNWLGLEQYTVAATQALTPGKASIRFEFADDGGGIGKGGVGRLLVNGQEVATGRIKEKPMRIWKGRAVVGAGLLLLGLTGPGALAQQPAQPADVEAPKDAMEDIQLTRAVIQAERQAIVTRAMDLTPEEMQRFWPVYREYRLEAIKLGDRIVSLVQRYVDDYDDLTDATADTLLTDFVKIEQARASLKAKFLPRFKKVLPVKKVVRFYQLENKLDITILAEMAEAIPLVR